MKLRHVPRSLALGQGDWIGQTHGEDNRGLAQDFRNQCGPVVLLNPRHGVGEHGGVGAKRRLQLVVGEALRGEKLLGIEILGDGGGFAGVDVEDLDAGVTRLFDLLRQRTVQGTVAVQEHAHMNRSLASGFRPTKATGDLGAHDLVGAVQGRVLVMAEGLVADRKCVGVVDAHEIVLLRVVSGKAIAHRSNVVIRHLHDLPSRQTNVVAQGHVAPA